MTRDEEVVEKARKILLRDGFSTYMADNVVELLTASGLLSSPSKERDAKLGRMVRELAGEKGENAWLSDIGDGYKNELVLLFGRGNPEREWLATKICHTLCRGPGDKKIYDAALRGAAQGRKNKPATKRKRIK